MPTRNLSPMTMFARMAAENRPAYAFKGRTPRDFAAWKKKALPAVLATLGDRPARVRPRPELVAEWEHDGLVKQRWLIDVGRHISAGFLINRPKGLSKTERRPALPTFNIPRKRRSSRAPRSGGQLPSLSAGSRE